MMYFILLLTESVAIIDIRCHYSMILFGDGNYHPI